MFPGSIEEGEEDEAVTEAVTGVDIEAAEGDTVRTGVTVGGTLSDCVHVLILTRCIQRPRTWLLVLGVSRRLSYFDFSLHFFPFNECLYLQPSFTSLCKM